MKAQALSQCLRLSGVVSSSVVGAQDPQSSSPWAGSCLEVPGALGSLAPVCLRVDCLFCLQCSVLRVLVIHPVLSRKLDSPACSFSGSFHISLPAPAKGGVLNRPFGKDLNRIFALGRTRPSVFSGSCLESSSGLTLLLHSST